MAALFVLAFFLGFAGATVGIVGEQREQHPKDGNLVTYRLNHPIELTTDHVVALLTSICGTLKPGFFGAVPTVGFELWATEAGLFHRLKVPWEYKEYILGQLQQHVPGLRYTPEEK